MLAPQAIATYVRSFVRCRSIQAFAPAIDSAPAGSRIDRVSSNTSFSAAHVASVSTSTMSSTYCCASRNVSLPTCFTATPSANRPTWASFTRRPAASERAIASESSGCTPITLMSGRTRFTYAAIPLISPPPPIATKIASIGPCHWRRISMPTVPCPAITSGIVVGMHERRPRALLQRERVRMRIAVRVAVQHDRRAARLDRRDLDVRRGHRHHDRRGAAEPLRRERDALRVIAGGRRDDAARALGGRQMRHLVVRAAQLEREHRLLVLALQQDAVAEPSRQRRREVERRLDRHVVHLRGQDLLQVVDGHREWRIAGGRNLRA